MKIHIEDLDVLCIIGLLDFERLVEQRCIINLEIDYTYTSNNFINYAEVATQVEEKLKKSKFELLEDALLEIKDMLFQNFVQIEQLYIKLSKPDIIPNCSVSLSQKWTNRPL